MKKFVWLALFVCVLAVALAPAIAMAEGLPPAAPPGKPDGGPIFVWARLDAPPGVVQYNPPMLWVPEIAVLNSPVLN